MVRLPHGTCALCLGLVLSGCGARSELSPSGAPTHTGGWHVPPAPSCATSAPVPTAIYTNAALCVDYLAIDADAVYLDDSGVYPGSGARALTRVPKCGGPAVALALHQEQLTDCAINVAVAAGNVVWFASNDWGDQISVVPAAPGGQARRLASYIENPAKLSDSIGLDADHAFYVDGAVKSVPLAGGTPTILASGQAIIAAVDDANVYFLQWPPTGTALASVPKSGGDVTFLGPSLVYYVGYMPSLFPWGYFAQDDDWIYWNTGVVMRSPKSGGPAEVVVAHEDVHGDNDLGTVLAVDDTHVYWATSAAIRRAPKTGGSAETLVTLPPFYCASPPLAVDAKSLYWWQGHSLMKLDK